MERELIGIKDCTGKDIRVGDVFEYGDRLYIVAKDEENAAEGNYYVRVYENQVEYGVEEESEYIEIGYMELEDIELNLSQIIGSIEESPYKELWEEK